MGDISYEPLIRDMTWSYSRIKAFDDCPYRWYLKYIRFPNQKGKKLFFADYGTFMHELLEAYYKGERTPDNLLDIYLNEFRQRVSYPAPSKKVFENYFADGVKCLRGLRRPEQAILSVEEKVEFSIKDTPFIGYIDLITESSDKSILLVDNKSRALKPRSNREKPTKADNELDEYLKQLYLYSIAVAKNYGKLPSKLCFNCFRKGVFIEEPFDQTAYHDASNWFLRRIEDIAVEHDFAPDIEYFKCRYLCEMQDYCEYYRLSRR